MKVKGESEVAQSCPTLSNPMDCSLPGSSVLGDSYVTDYCFIILPHDFINFIILIKGLFFVILRVEFI